MYLMLFRQLLSAILTTQKSADKSIVSVGDTITYTTTITNTRIYKFYRAIQASIFFIPYSSLFLCQMVHTKNGVQSSLVHQKSQIETVTFQIKLTPIPPSNSIMGNDTILYSYTVDPNGTPITTSISTNIVTNPVLDAMITMVKSPDQTLVTLGDTITNRQF